jgi:uncharacterized protein (TIGR03435 family)
VRIFLSLIQTGLLLILSGPAMAQTDARTKPVAGSIKPSAPDAPGKFVHLDPAGGFDIANMSLKEIIAVAWNIPPHQISGGPSWLNSDRYDVSVRLPADSARGDAGGKLLQSLLIDRFHLVFHRETREQSAWSLVMARQDGHLGPGLKESKTACEPSEPAQPPPPLSCGTIGMAGEVVTGKNIPISRLTTWLSRLFERPVIDRTGLSDEFDLRFDLSSYVIRTLVAPDAPKPWSPGSPNPTFFAAFEDQLGLRLDASRAPVDLLVIERTEKPSMN